VAKLEHISYDSLLKSLDDACGDLAMLSRVLETKNRALLWSAEEDAILESITSRDSLEFRIIRKFKGLESIQRRIKYKGLKLNFQL